MSVPNVDAPDLWLVLAFGTERQYGGNLGYEDNPAEVYRYDSFVANHKQVAAGDWMIVCDRERALGLAKIRTIDASDGKKEQQRCPQCGTTGLKERKKLRPRYRCFNGHLFHQPTSAVVKCTEYAAHFGPFLQFQEQVSRRLLRNGVLKPSDQVTMQRFSFELVSDELGRVAPNVFAMIRTCVSGGTISPDSADRADSDTTAADVIPKDRALKQVLSRRGQAGFREALRKRYGDRCLISGCSLMDVVEAAHICVYPGKDDHNPENGVLLRSDLHTLFDLNLLGIEPGSLRIHLHPAACVPEYARFHGQLLLCSGKQPAKHALEIRWAAFTSRLPVPESSSSSRSMPLGRSGEMEWVHTEKPEPAPVPG